MSELRELAPWVSAVCAFLALMVSSYVAWHTYRSRQLDIFDRAYRRILELEEKFLEESARGTTSAAALAWRASFLNALEYFALMINERHVSDPRLLEYFREPIIRWYETIFLRAASENDIQDPTVYPELKRLYVLWHQGLPPAV